MVGEAKKKKKDGMVSVQGSPLLHNVFRPSWLKMMVRPKNGQSRLTVTLRLRSEAEMLRDPGNEVWHTAEKEAISPLPYGAQHCERTLNTVTNFFFSSQSINVNL